ncbi:hypothetical protein B0H12DRAFT_1100262 [Mycena haematopus]|nr:hypothetical protein B0H12DRAFT_1100262 [Mycena haematopus]
MTEWTHPLDPPLPPGAYSPLAGAPPPENRGYFPPEQQRGYNPSYEQSPPVQYGQPPPQQCQSPPQEHSKGLLSGIFGGHSQQPVQKHGVGMGGVAMGNLDQPSLNDL